MTRKPPTAVALGGVAAIRAFASIWLHRIDNRLTRQHVQSPVVAVAVVAGLGVAHLAKRVGARREPPAVASDRVACQTGRPQREPDVGPRRRRSVNR